MPSLSLPYKITSALLSLLLIFSFVPTFAFADQIATDSTSDNVSNSEQQDGNNGSNNQSDGVDDPEASSSDDAASSTNSEAVEDQEVNDSETFGINTLTESGEDAAQDVSSLQTNENEANDQANSWRFVDGDQIYSYEGASTDGGNPGVSLFAASPGASSHATWYKSNGTTSYTYKAEPDDAGQNISVSGAKRVGIDVSYHNGTIDWAKVKNSGVSFAIIRCGYGSDFTSQDDVKFFENVRGAQENGIDIGIYLYSYAMNTTGNDSSAASEARHVLRLLDEAGLEPNDLAYPVFFDMEESKQLDLGSKKLGELASTFCNAISAEGYEVGIYSNLNWWSNYLTDSAFDNSNWHKWAARYPGSNKATSSGVPGTEIWQFSDCGHVDGVNGNVDMNFDYAGSYNSPLVQDSKGLRYVKEDGSFAENEWITYKDKKYYFGNDTYALRWSQTIDGDFYYFNDDYTMHTGWLTWASDGTRSYFQEDGTALSGWQTLDGKRYYFDAENNYHAYRWSKTIGNDFYYFNDDCSMHTGWLTWASDNSRSYFGDDGIALSGWRDDGSKRYYIDPDTHKTLRWSQTIDGDFYYFNDDYTMHTGWLTWASDNSRSYFGDDGIALSGWRNDGSSRYFISSATLHTVRWSQVIDGKQYYFDDDCKMHIGPLVWAKDGSMSFFGLDGVITSGWQNWQGKTYYIDPVTMRAVKWGNTINGQYYYFDSDYSLYNKGWLKWYADNTYSYFDSRGIMYKGWHTIDGIDYNFGSSGKCTTYDWLKADMAKKAQIYVSDTGYLILVDRGNHKVSVFQGSFGNWHLIYYWSCVTGTPSTPTITGSYYTTGFKRTSLSTDSRAVWCTQIWGGYFFHSILASESELGNSLSHGCIRLSHSAALWMYNNIYSGTRVIIYN